MDRRQKHKIDKQHRREAINNLLRRNPCLTDEELAKEFSVSVATIRLDRQALGIPQMRARMESVVAVSGHPAKVREGLRILDVDLGIKGVGLFDTTADMADKAGFVSAETFYGAAADFAEALSGIPFASTQVGNIKYKVPVKPGTLLVVKGRIVLMRGNKKHIYVSFFDGETEVYRSKFIMEVLNQTEAFDGKDSR